MSDSTADMSVSQWQENPTQVIEMIRTGNIDLKGPAKNQIFPKGLYGFVLKFFVGSFAGFEKQSARLGYLYTYGYARFRPCFLHLGELFATKKFVNESTDIFYLDMSEIRTLIETEEFSQKYLEAIKERKTEIEKCKDMLLPEVIFGDTSPPMVRKGSISRLLRGLPVSRGYFEGKVKVVRSISEAAKVLKGDVLVIPYSDISWTPLLSKAGAIISEAGGLLSHCSIVARELGIPAVVGVEGATMIPDNTEARIDGYTGEVLVIQ
jgi:pyruvate,water dikinase